MRKSRIFPFHRNNKPKLRTIHSYTQLQVPVGLTNHQIGFMPVGLEDRAYLHCVFLGGYTARAFNPIT